jgi:hypothetical protein
MQPKNSRNEAGVSCLQDISRSMEENMNDLKKLTSAFNLMEACLPNPASTSTYAATDVTRAIRNLVQVLQSHKDEPQLQRRACINLVKLCGPNAVGDINCFYSAGGLDALLAGMNRHSDDVHLVFSGAELITKVTDVIYDLPQKSVDAATDAVLAGMRLHNQYPDFAGLSTIALGGLVLKLRDDARLQSIIISILVSARKHPDDPKIQAAVIVAFGRVCLASEQNIHMLWKAKVLPVALSCMEGLVKAGNPADSLCDGMIMLAAMYQYAPQPQQANEGLAAIPRAMKSYRAHRELQILCLRALVWITKYNSESVKQSGKTFTTQVIECMADYKDDSQMVSLTFEVLHDMSTASPAVCTGLCEEGTLRTILNFMNKHLKHDECQENALQLLASITGAKALDLPAKEMFCRLGCVSAVSKAMERHLKGVLSMLLQVHGSMVITAISHPAFNCSVNNDVAQQGGALALIRAMNAYPYVPELQGCALAGLHNILIGNKHTEVVGMQCIRPIVQALSTHDLNQEAAGCSLLREIFTVPRNNPRIREYQDILGNCGGIKVMAESLKAFTTGPPQAAKRMDVDKPSVYVNNPITVLMIASMGHRRNQDRCWQEGVVSAIVQAMSAFKNDKGTLSVGCSALHAITAGHEANTEMLINENNCAKRLFRAKALGQETYSFLDGMIDDLVNKLTSGDDEKKVRMYVCMYVCNMHACMYVMCMYLQYMNVCRIHAYMCVCIHVRHHHRNMCCIHACT